MKTHDTPEKDYDLERAVFFSDGVFAIAITLMVLELHPPEGWDGHIGTLLHALAVKLIFYFITFTVVGAFWMSHRFMFRHVRRLTEPLAWLNLLFLALIGLAPLANLLLGAGHFGDDATWTYVGLMGLTALAGGILWAYIALFSGVIDPAVTLRYKLLMLARMSVVPPLACAGSLWLTRTYGMVPAFVFLGVMIGASNLLRVRAKRAGKSPA